MIKKLLFNILFFFLSILIAVDSNAQTDSINFTGLTFPRINLLDTSKQNLTLSLHPDTIYLVDYWASWCLPCIKYKLPMLKELQKNYNEKKFKIISISLDNDYNAWVNSIYNNAISWENYSALSGFKTEDVKLFHITGIPFTILVGKDSKIVKMDPSESDIQSYLEKNLP